MNLQFRAVLLLEFLDFIHDAALQKDRLLPFMAGQRGRGNVLGGIVDAGSFLDMLRPIRGKYLKCLSAQQQIEGPAHLLAHDLTEKIVKIGNYPAAIGEASAWVFCRPAGSLHDAIHRDKCQDDYFSHGSFPPCHTRSTLESYPKSHSPGTLALIIVSVQAYQMLVLTSSATARTASSIRKAITLKPLPALTCKKGVCSDEDRGDFRYSW